MDFETYPGWIILNDGKLKVYINIANIISISLIEIDEKYVITLDKTTLTFDTSEQANNAIESILFYCNLHRSLRN